MKISKLLPVLCALAVGANSLTVRAEDTPAQAAARIALAKKLFELDAQKPEPTNAIAAKPGAAKVESAHKTTDDDVVMTPVNPPTAKEAKAKAKAEKAAAAAKAKQEAAQAAADVKAKKEADKKLAAQQAAAAKSQADKTAAEADANREAQKKAVLAQTSADKPAPAAQPVAQPVAKAKKEKKQKPAPAVVAAPQPAKAAANFAGKDLGMKPIAAPALPIAASKADRLQALLEKYKADQISPEEYHQQRAAVLAEP